jgi:hypothetical protein
LEVNGDDNYDDDDDNDDEALRADEKCTHFLILYCTVCTVHNAKFSLSSQTYMQ